MIRLFFIIYSGTGLIGGVIGPLPYDLEECHRRVAEYQTKADAKPEISKGMRFACEYHAERPQMSERD